MKCHNQLALQSHDHEIASHCILSMTDFDVLFTSGNVCIVVVPPCCPHAGSIGPLSAASQLHTDEDVSFLIVVAMLLTCRFHWHAFSCICSKRPPQPLQLQQAFKQGIEEQPQGTEEQPWQEEVSWPQGKEAGWQGQ